MQHRYVGEAWRFRRYAMGNLLPEIDQFRFSFKVMPALDKLFTRLQARELEVLTTSIYDELDADPDFHALGSVMQDAYSEILGRDFDHGHYFLYIPPMLDRSVPHPAIVFLHGSGGNFKAYTWLLAKLADKLGMIVVAPSYGFGNWHQPHSSRVVNEAIADAARQVKLDTQHLHLIGLSNGGLGTSQCGAVSSTPFQTLVFLSPVFDSPAINSLTFQANWRGKEILIITGKEDDRVPFSYVTRTAESLRNTGIRVAFHPVNGANHFMLFSHQTEVLGEIEHWMTQRHPKNSQAAP